MGTFFKQSVFVLFVLIVVLYLYQALLTLIVLSYQI